MKNIIYAGYESNVTVNVNGIIPLNTIVKKFNRKNAMSKVDLVGNAVAVEVLDCDKPRYNGVAKVTFAGVAAGDGVIAVYKNNAKIPFADATSTITTAETQFTTVTIPFSIIADGCATTGITLVNTGAIDIIVTSASILLFED